MKPNVEKIKMCNIKQCSSRSASVLRERHPPALAAVPGDSAGSDVPRDAAHQLLPLHRYDVLLRAN